MEVIYFYSHFKVDLCCTKSRISTTSLVISVLYASIGWNSKDKFQNKSKQHKLSSQKNLTWAKDFFVFFLQSQASWGLRAALKLLLLLHTLRMALKEKPAVNFASVYIIALESIRLWVCYLLFLHFPLLFLIPSVSINNIRKEVVKIYKIIIHKFITGFDMQERRTQDRFVC